MSGECDGCGEHCLECTCGKGGMMETDAERWQPIETAPTDWSEDVDLWVTYPRRFGQAQRVTDCRASLTNGKPDWHTRSDEYGWTRLTSCTPTHWMPLPKPPTPTKDTPQ